MATIAQLRANQLNARKSTGPKTPAGKARCAQNPTKHGLTAKTTVVLHEDAAEFEDLKQLLIEEFNPPTRWMTVQVEYLAHHWWKVLRTARAETGMWNKLLISMADAEGIQHDPNLDCDEGIGCLFDRTPKPIELQRRYTATIERAYYKQLAIVERPDSPRVAKKRRDAVRDEFRSRQPKPQAAAAGASARFDALLAKAEAIVGGAPSPLSPATSQAIELVSSPVAPVEIAPEAPVQTPTPELRTTSVNPSPSLPPAKPTQAQQTTSEESIGSVSQFPTATLIDNPVKEDGNDR